jgi:hypothetical protein
MSKKRKRGTPKRPQRPRYLDQVRAAGAQQGPGVYHVEVRHDAWCDLLHGRGPCNCNPTVQSGAAINRKYGG